MLSVVVFSCSTLTYDNPVPRKYYTYNRIQPIYSRNTKIKPMMQHPTRLFLYLISLSSINPSDLSCCCRGRPAYPAQLTNYSVAIGAIRAYH